MSYALRILHISDFHDRADAEKSAWRRRRVLGDAWLENLKFLKNDGPQFDFVFFTGDIAFSGKSTELNSASEFIDTTLSTLGVPYARLMLVPGNHDVDRSIAASEWKALREFWNHENDAAMSSWLAGGKPPPGASPAWLDEVARRSGAFRGWVHQKLNRAELLPENSPHGRLGYQTSFVLPGLPFPIHVVGFDSAWLAGDNDDARKLRITEDQAMRLSTNTSGDGLEGLRLGLIHHPLGELADGEHCRTLIANKIDLLFRGHLHSPELLTISDPDRALSEVAAGCLYEHDRYPNGCTSLTLTLDKKGGIDTMEVHLRAWSTNGFWFNDDSRYRHSQSGRIRLTASLSDGRRIFSYAPSTAIAATRRGSFERLEERLRARTHDDLVSADGSATFKLPRDHAADEFAQAVEAVIPQAEIILVSGEPGVGKSALALTAVSRLRARGYQVACLSLRDLPTEVAQMNSVFERSTEEAFRAASKKGHSVLVVDGSEAILEGREAVFGEIFAAALREQYAVAVVARDDAHEALRSRCAELIRGSREIRAHRVPGFDADEIKQLVQAFPILTSLEAAPGALWLLARPGWVGLLLRSSPAALVEADTLSEAQVFAIIWRGLVRRNEILASDRATPDGRETALLALASRSLLGTPTQASDPFALTSLRRDGLLLPFETFGSGDDFAHDLIRDFATARLLLTSPETLLSSAGAPRWALRATRLAFQAALLAAKDLAGELQRQLRLCRKLAADHGDRWLDLAIEALVALEGAVSIDAAWPALASDDGAGLERLTQWLWLHRCNNGVADVAATTPFIDMICTHADSLGELEDQLEDSGLIDSVLMAWLRGLAKRVDSDTPNVQRQRLRDRFLRATHETATEWILEAIALLGPDLDGVAEAFLRQAVQLRPDRFADVVEGVGAYSLAAHRIDLLFFLAEAYYIDSRVTEYGHEDGIRRHARGTHTPLAAWYYGPFLPLLRRDFKRGFRLINKLLNHGAKARAAKLEELSDIETHVTSVAIEAPFVGVRNFVGDAHTWRWYRATGVGPYPCISALMALEKVVDEILVQVPELPLARIVARLLDGAESLAMPGFIVGMLTRQLERVSDDFDVWLTNEAVWRLEIERVIGEHSSFIGTAAESTEPQRERRRWSMHELAQHLTAHAVLDGSKPRIEALQRVGERLIQKAAVSRGGKDPGRTVRKFASVLDARNYKPIDGADGYVVYTAPPELQAEFAPDQEALARSQAAWHLVFKYRPEVADPFDGDSPTDLEVARALEKEPPTESPTVDRDEGPILFASRAVVAHFHKRLVLADDDLRWAVSLLMRNARTKSDTIFADSISPTGLDRSVAAALPMLYAHFSRLEADDEGSKPAGSGLARRKDGGIGRKSETRAGSQSADALDAIATLAVRDATEVRTVLASAVSAVWSQPCMSGSECFHRKLFGAVRTAAARCLYGFDAAQGRDTVTDADEPLELTLPHAEARSLALDWLTPSIVAVGAGASSNSCVATEAATLRAVLLDAHARAMGLRVNGQWGPYPINLSPVARVLLDAGRDAIASYFEALGDSAAPIAWLLEHLARVAAEMVDKRSTLIEVWPLLFDRVLALAPNWKKDRYWGPSALARLLPALKSPSDDWIRVEFLGDRLLWWAQASAGMPDCIDALAVALQGTPLLFQLGDGLRVVRGMMLDFAEVARRTEQVLGWLAQLEGHIDWAKNANDDFIAIVDGLVAAGDVNFVEMQRLLDQRIARRT